MECYTISQVSRSYGVSTRMLRYYEKEGLLHSRRREDYAYRIYDEEAVARLQQILLLRKLRIPLKQIKLVLQNQDAVTAIQVFLQNMAELDGEIGALSTVRDILSHLVQALTQAADLPLHLLLTGDSPLLQSIQALSLTSINFREDQAMKNMQQADKQLSKLTDVRIVYLPPAAVASAHHVGENPEQHAGGMIDRFVRESGLCRIKPDLRRYGFNHPNPSEQSPVYGYEAWVTIPDDMEVPAPLTRQRFEGGLYAAHMIAMGNFHEWDWLLRWVNESEEYEFAGNMADQEHMCGLLDEHLNYISHAHLENTEPEGMQVDLLMPVREKKAE